MFVKQEIPDGDFCAVWENECVETEIRCIFSDRDIHFERRGSGYGCRRYPRYELCVERTDDNKKRIHKCPDCLRETNK